MTDPRASIVAYIRREGLDELAREIETYADLKRPEPTIPAEVWMKEGNLR